MVSKLFLGFSDDIIIKCGWYNYFQKIWPVARRHQDKGLGSHQYYSGKHCCNFMERLEFSKKSMDDSFLNKCQLFPTEYDSWAVVAFVNCQAFSIIFFEIRWQLLNWNKPANHRMKTWQVLQLCRSSEAALSPVW